jgi:hypothetical protein
MFGIDAPRAAENLGTVHAFLRFCALALVAAAPLGMSAAGVTLTSEVSGKSTLIIAHCDGNAGVYRWSAGQLTAWDSDGVVLHPFVADRIDGTLAGDGRFLGLGLNVHWKISVPEGARYFRLTVTLNNSGGEPVSFRRLSLAKMVFPGAHRVGDVRGSVVVAGSLFMGIEDPLAQNEVKELNGVSLEDILIEPVAPGQTVTVSAVFGFARDGQVRRDFLAYLERERPRSYAPFLHHNTWYNIGYFTRFTEEDELRVVDAFTRELVRARGVTLDGFVLDDGWDDPQTLWHFHRGFPSGLGPVAARARQAGAVMGMWLSPWGGYGPPKKQRLAAAAPEGFETREGSFSLAGPRYYARFRELCVGQVRTQGVGYFKFDGIGSEQGPDQVDPAAERDFAAMMRLIRELRGLAPGIYINQTTGTWASPFWLLRVDSIWRGGDDHDFAGVGTFRQRWITYRDADTYAEVVRRGPLYPLNSLMLHGIIYGAKAKHLSDDPGGDFRSEVRSFFGTGTQLQELYVSPELLTKANWDDLAAAARWSRSHASMLVDTHWVGGDPAKGEVYGWAAWNPSGAVLTLRNPSDTPATFPVDPAAVFELPHGAAGTFAVRGAYADTPSPVARLTAGTTTAVTLAPFEVLVLEATPAP